MYRLIEVLIWMIAYIIGDFLCIKIHVTILQIFITCYKVGKFLGIFNSGWLW